MIDSLRRAWNRMLANFRSNRLDAELDAEIASHIEAATEQEQREARGLPFVDVVNTILLRPLPCQRSGRLVWLATNGGKAPQPVVRGRHQRPSLHPDHAGGTRGH